MNVPVTENYECLRYFNKEKQKNREKKDQKEEERQENKYKKPRIKRKKGGNLEENEKMLKSSLD